MQKKQYLFDNILILFFFLVIIFNVMAYANQKTDGSNKHERLGSLNLDFEKANPDGWLFGGNGYQVVLDKSEKKNGKQSLCFYGPKGVNPGRVSFAAQKVLINPFLGKRIRLSGYVKTGKKVGDIYLWLRADCGLDPLAFKRIHRDKGPKKEIDWQEYILEMDVPRQASALFFGASMRGEGKAWLDYLRIGVLPAKGPELITLSGKVVDKQGNTIPDALVTVKTFYQESALKIVRGGKNGKFSFKLLPGFYTINGCAAGQTRLVTFPGREISSPLLFNTKFGPVLNIWPL